MVTRYEIMKQKATKHRQLKTKKLVSKVSLGMIFLSSSLALEQASIQLNNQPSFTKRVQAKNSPKEFLNLISGYAKDIAADNDLYASVMIAQAALESAWGNSSLASEYNNLFGIKGEYQGKSVNMDTLEDDGSGKLYGIKAGFRAYDNYGQSLEDYASLLTGDHNPDSWSYNYYKGVLKSNTKSYKDATAWLTGRYATDTSYGSKLNSIIESYGLTDFDLGSKEKEAVEPNTYSASQDLTLTATKPASPAVTNSKSTGTYKVQAGDSIWRIANRYGMTLDELRTANNLSGDFIYPGQELVVTGSNQTVQPKVNESQITPVRQENHQTSQVASSGTYVVKMGDSVWGISNRFGMSMDQLRSLNNLSGNYIYPGQSLKVSAGQVVEKAMPVEVVKPANDSQPVSQPLVNLPATSANSATYTVKAGDSVWGIANRHGVSMDSLCQANGIKAYVIHAGQTLVIPSSANNQAMATNQVMESEKPVIQVTYQAEPTVDEVASNPSPQAQSTYVVQRGDSLYAIAAKHGISVDSLIELNGFSGYNQLILPGQTILV